VALQASFDARLAEDLAHHMALMQVQAVLVEVRHIKVHHRGLEQQVKDLLVVLAYLEAAHLIVAVVEVVLASWCLDTQLI
jgi:hypothetical protein